ncbi:MAG: rhodanese-like domain-containing protein, partial [Alistipes sp.]|nr:rhodanese-like domain-containing protein [Alistipes sp.]
MRKMLYVLFAATILVSCGTNRNRGYDSVDADSFAKFIGNEQVHIIDSRTPVELNSGHIPGAININFDDENFSAKV